MDLRGHVEIRIGRRLADAIFQMRRRIARRRRARGASRRGCRAPRRARSAPSSWRRIALVAVDRRRGEGGGRARVRQQSAQGSAVPSGDSSSPVSRRARTALAPSCASMQRLVQMPAAGHHIGQPRPAHEARVRPCRRATCFTALRNSTMMSAGASPPRGCEGELELARPKLDLDRAQRQAERLTGIAADTSSTGSTWSKRDLGEILKAVGE